MSAANSVSPPSATPSAQPQSQHLFPPPPTSAPTPTPTSSSSAAAPPLQQQQQPPLPPPQTFDILPPLHALLSRLEPSLNTYTTDPISTFAANKSSTNASLFASSGNGVSFSQTTAVAGQQQGQLSYKDVVTASQFLKARMRKALVELGKLGDMDRDVKEQEEEIRELEERIRKQKGVLGGLAEKARTAELGGAAGDEAKEGWEKEKNTLK